MQIRPGDDLLLIIDVQNDFCPGGALAVAEGDAIVPVINRLSERFGHVAVTQDWHPFGHSSFASSHPGSRAFETIATPYGPQTLRPDHCVQSTSGARFTGFYRPSGRNSSSARAFVPKSIPYSAFFENDRRTPTGLAGYLRERGLKKPFGWARHRLLRALFRGRCAPARLRYRRHRSRLQGDRPERLAGGCLDQHARGRRAADRRSGLGERDRSGRNHVLNFRQPSFPDVVARLAAFAKTSAGLRPQVRRSLLTRRSPPSDEGGWLRRDRAIQ